MHDAAEHIRIYVLEYLLGQYCASTDPEIVARGLDYVRETLSRNYVRADEGEKVKARLDTTVDHFWAELWLT